MANCKHERAEIVFYQGHALGAQHRTVHWCPRCGALGMNDYTSGTSERWRLPGAKDALPLAPPERKARRSA